MSCDFREVAIEQEEENRVRVSAAKGRAPTPTYKVSATQQDGLRCAGSLVIVGIDAEKKARRTGRGHHRAHRRILRESGLPPFTSTHIEVHRRRVALRPACAHARDAREVMMRVVANHPQKAALEMFAREIAPAGTSWAPGTTGPAAGGPRCRR